MFFFCFFFLISRNNSLFGSFNSSMLVLASSHLLLIRYYSGCVNPFESKTNMREQSLRLWLPSGTFCKPLSVLPHIVRDSLYSIILYPSSPAHHSAISNIFSHLCLIRDDSPCPPPPLFFSSSFPLFSVVSVVQTFSQTS